ncbi:50S ribosomal protein L19 [Candidatus Saccharibacteria bacterium]|nr:50S ribosomal protein L19 [Candidatus Saccharibacteria bacterium]MBI3338109.1 50S ribosomal protein L19 [Candidatus Saccharibacteria bacterium]
MQSVIQKIEEKYKKAQVVDVRSGDTVKVHQKIREGVKERVQIFQGLVIRTDRKSSHTSRITVRRVASGVGVEKSFLLHSPLVVKVEVSKRSKVRRNYLTYMRQRTGKSARLTGMDFDKEAVNIIRDETTEKIETEAATPIVTNDTIADNVAKTKE